MADISKIKLNGSVRNIKDSEARAGLSDKQNTINNNNKLSADLIDDTNATNKFTNAADKMKMERIIMDSTEDTLLYVQATQPTGTIPEGSIWINTAVSGS